MSRPGGKSSLPLISIAILVLNEADNLDFLHKSLDNLTQRMNGICELEFIFSDNHFLGVLGECLLGIYVILREEPIALIEQSLNLDSSDLKL